MTNTIPQYILKVRKDILEMRLKANIPAITIIQRLGLQEDAWAVNQIIQTEWDGRTNKVKALLSDGQPHTNELVEYVRTAREIYNLTYFQIAHELEVDESVIYDIVFYNKVTKGVGKYLKGSFTREEKHYRNQQMIKLNEDGLTLAAIGAKFHLTKQRVSILFKEMNYTPITTHALKSITTGKYREKFEEIAGNDLLDQLDALRKDLRVTKQRNAVAKYHYNKMVIGLRCKLLMQYMLHWDEENRADYLANRKVLVTIYNEAKNSPTYTKEVQTIHDILIRMDTFEKVNKFKLSDKDTPIVTV